MAIYYAPFFRNYQIIILALSSMVFYGYGQPFLLLLLIASVSINAFVSYFIHFSESNQKKIVLTTIGVLANLLILSLFKYGTLISSSLRSYVGLDNQAISFLSRIPLPIGISFYTFQGISLVVDTYRQNKNRYFTSYNINQKFLNHYINTFLYITFFPQLVAGPIVRASLFFPQIRLKNFSEIKWHYALRSIILGYFLKMVIADQLKDQTYWISFPYYQSYSSLTLCIMLFGYSMQIFADFAGYSIIAIGIAYLFGYNLPTNFNFPYISKSFSEFWTRWHISLSSWLKEYLYIPIGGNKKGKIRTYINLTVVMLLGGLWHGASWKYAMWGLWHGLALVIERPFRDRLKKYNNLFLDISKTIAVFVFITLGWLLFKLDNLSQVLDYAKCIVMNVNMIDNYLVIIAILYYSFPIVAYYAYHLIIAKFNLKPNVYFEAISYGIMIFMLVTSSGNPSAFIYFQF
jgi:alginate O-acetyltransferase complex protein AlgI